MRGTRWLLLSAILVVLGGTGVVYYLQQRTNLVNAAPKPPAIAQGLSGTAEDWEWSRTDAGRLVVKIRAHSFRQVENSAKFELEGVRLYLYQKDNLHFDLVKSPKADFYQNEGKMLSRGEVEITLNVPIGGEPTPDLTTIKSNGITFESKTGKASTDQPTSFRFAGGDGTSIGAGYDPTTRELHLAKDVVLNLRGKTPGAKPMKVETGDLTYKESGSVIWLLPTARLSRDTSVLDAGPTIVTLEDGKIKAVDAQKGHGVDSLPKRELHYSADTLHVDYDEDGKVKKVVGTGNPELLSAAPGSNTKMNADTVTLDFVPEDGESKLTHATGDGHAVIESSPAAPGPNKGAKAAETRILRSAYIDLFMRDGGREIDKVQTQAPGTLEFLPNEPDQHRRLLNGERMTIAYGAQNQVKSFASNKVTTETFPSAAEKAKAEKSKAAPPAVSKTSSDNMTADFDDKGQMTRMKQWDNFAYEEADRRARAATATLDNAKNLMDLDAQARIWDNSGSTDADHIQIDQKTGNYVADGHVSTSRMPDKDPKKTSSDLLDGDEPVQGTSAHMTSANKNRQVHYDGNAVLWQGSDRVQADKIDIDREKHNLIADGQVVTQLIDKQKESAPKPAVAAPFTVVKAPHLVYTDETRLAHYTGGATLNRPGLWVKGDEIRAFLSKKEEKDKKESDSSRLDKAFSDGAVEIVDTTPIRKRTGTGVHAEYYTDDERVILRGNQALLVDSLKGTSRGAELTYFSDDDKLVVESTPTTQVKSHLIRKK